MDYRLARRLTAESNKRGDEFLKARDLWQNGQRTERLRRECVDTAHRYEAALQREIEYLETMEESHERKIALDRAHIYRRLLARQIHRLELSLAA